MPDLPTAAMIAAAGTAHEARRRLMEAAGAAEDVRLSWYYVDQREPLIARAQALASGRTPAELHAEWCEHRRGLGYTLGPGGPDAPLTHPGLVPWEDLPPEVRALDELEQSIVIDVVTLWAAYWPS